MKDYKTASPDRYRLLKGFALENRQNPTLAEQVLWKHIRAEQLDVKVLRQHIIGDYIVDFLIPDVSLIIEVDGAYHTECEQMQEDKQREETLDRMVEEDRMEIGTLKSLGFNNRHIRKKYLIYLKIIHII